MSHKSLLPLAVIAALAASPWLQPTASYAQAPTARDLPTLIMLVRHAVDAAGLCRASAASIVGRGIKSDPNRVVRHGARAGIVKVEARSTPGSRRGERGGASRRTRFHRTRAATGSEVGRSG